MLYRTSVSQYIKGIIFLMLDKKYFVNTFPYLCYPCGCSPHLLHPNPLGFYSGAFFKQ